MLDYSQIQLTPPMSFSHHALLGIHAVAIISTCSSLQPVTAAKLARDIGLCLSSTEMIVKKLRNGGLINSHRGPGGGYRLQQAVEHLSVWDVVSCFKDSDLPTLTEHTSPESQAALALANHLDTTLAHFLQDCRFTDVLKHLDCMEPQDAHSTLSHTAFHLKPLREPALPVAPSWVFDLAKFTHAAHA